MPINFQEAGGQVRLLISDVDEANQILTDDQITGYLARYGVSFSGPPAPRAPINRAAADALDAIAVSEALVQKVLSTVDGLKTDGAKLADALRSRAWSLRNEAGADEASGDGTVSAYFGVAEFHPGPSRHEAEEARSWGW